MGVEENKAIVRRFFDSATPSPMDLVADDATFTMVVKGAMGVRRSKAQFIELQKSAMARATGPNVLKLLSMVAEGNTVVVEAEGRLPLASGKVYANNYSIYLELANGRITRVREYFDTAYMMDMFEGPL
jgi:ketosteroid isomerase-like protein